MGSPRSFLVSPNKLCFVRRLKILRSLCCHGSEATPEREPGL